MRTVGLVLLGAALVGCAPVETGSPSGAIANPAAYSQQLRAAETSRLCGAYLLPSTSEQARLMIEAELAVRGMGKCGGTNIGSQSAAQVGVSRYGRSGTDTGVGGQDYDCGDFGGEAQAQRFFLASGGPASDPHNLDGDGDGAACEWGTEIRRIASRVRPAPMVAPRPAVVPTPAPVRSAGSGCFVGPRGGTYTITSGGNRNYSGC